MLKERIKSLEDVGHYRTPRYARDAAFERAGARRTLKDANGTVFDRLET